MAGIQIDGVNNKIDFDDDQDTSISSATDDTLVVEVGGTTLATATATSLTINDGVTINVTDNSDALTLTSTDADANEGPVIVFDRNSSSSADADFIGALSYRGRNDADQGVDYCKIYAQIDDASDGTEDSQLFIKTFTNGTSRNRMGVYASGTVFNDDSQDIDFRVESNDLDDCLMVNAGNNQLCVGRQAGEGNERLSVEQTEADWCHVNIHSRSSGNIYMFNNKFTGQAPDNNVSYFTNFQDFDGGATIRFRVFSDGDVQNHDNSYGSTSDERIKSEIVDANSQWDDIKALKVRNYKRNDDIAQYGDKAWVQIGVIAQELEASGMDKLVKNEVLWDKDDPEVKSGEATEGDVKEYKGVKYSVLYMKAIKALQEAQTRIETLETKVTALENN